MSDLSKLTEEERNLASLPHAGTYHVHQGHYMEQAVHHIYTPANTEPVCMVFSYAPVALSARAIALALNAGPKACQALNDARAEVETVKHEIVVNNSLTKDWAERCDRLEAERDAALVALESERVKLHGEIERMNLCEAHIREHTTYMLRHFGLDSAAESCERNRIPLEQSIAQVISECVALGGEKPAPAKGRVLDRTPLCQGGEQTGQTYEQIVDSPDIPDGLPEPGDI